MNQRPLRLPFAAILLATALWAAASAALAQDRPDTIADAIRAEPALAETASLFEESGMLDQLARPGRFTFFAPSDRAWEVVDARVLRDLRRDRGALDAIVRHHLLTGASPLHALRRLDAVTTLETTRLPVTRSGDVVRVGGVRIVNEGIETGNGVLYVVNQVLVPGGPFMIKDMLASPRR